MHFQLETNLVSPKIGRPVATALARVKTINDHRGGQKSFF